MSQLNKESKILERTPSGNILEIIFQGTHDWTHGAQMDEYIKEKNAETKIAAIIFNLLDYHYEWGNDVAGLFMAAIDRKKKDVKIRPVCIVATGTTYTSLHEFFKISKILDTFKIEFVSKLELALQKIKERLEKNSI